MATLHEMLLAPDVKPQVITDCEELVNNEVSGMAGISGTAIKLAYMYGDPHSQAAFAKMPIVIVAYSGGFGPTLSVLDRGGVRSRVLTSRRASFESGINSIFVDCCCRSASMMPSDTAPLS